MKRIEIFKPGKHTAMSGAVLQFSESDLQGAADAYDPALHEAPLVVGHPKDNGPAYGWVKSLAFGEGVLAAEPDQVDTAFAELVAAGRFKKVSASFYTPDSPSNPKPGTYYLRHVGFLGAQPPAVKGLKSASFADAEEGVVEFTDWGMRDAGSLFAQLREWLIGKFGLDEANKALPSWQIDSVKEAARDDDKPTTSLGYAELKENATVSKTTEQLAAEAAELKKREDAVAAREASFAEREKTARHAQLVEFVGGLVKDGRVLPKDKDRLVAFMETLPAEATVLEFAEDGKTPVKTPALQVFQAWLKSLPKQVDFSERAGADKQPGEQLGNEEAASRARTYRDKKAAKGEHISYAEAVDAVNAGKDKE